MASLRETLNLKTEILGGAQTHFIKSQMNLEWPFKTKLELGRRPFLNGGTNQGAGKRRDKGRGRGEGGNERRRKIKNKMFGGKKEKKREKGNNDKKNVE